MSFHEFARRRVTHERRAEVVIELSQAAVRHHLVEQVVEPRVALAPGDVASQVDRRAPRVEQPAAVTDHQITKLARQKLGVGTSIGVRGVDVGTHVS